MRALIVLVLVLGLAACNRATADVPEDFSTVDRPVFAVSHPQEWERMVDEEEKLEVRGPIGEGNIQRALTVEVDRQFSGDFDNAVDGIEELGALMRRDDRDLRRDEPVDVPGAERARMLEGTWSVTNSAGDDVAMRGIDVFALTPEGLMVYLSVFSAESDYDEETAEQILGSFEVR